MDFIILCRISGRVRDFPDFNDCTELRESVKIVIFEFLSVIYPFY